MQNKVFENYAIAIIGLIESERDISLDRTNDNGVRFETIIGFAGGFSLHYSISFDDTELMKNFYYVIDPAKVTLQGIINAVKDMADYFEENKYIDQWELKNLIQDIYENN